MSGIPYLKLPDLELPIAIATSLATATVTTAAIAITTAISTETTSTVILTTNSTSTSSTSTTTVSDTPTVSAPEPAASKPSNIIGFENNNWYKIRNVADNSVVEVDPKSRKLICMPESSDKNDLQNFRAVVQPNGKFRISAKFQKSPDACQVWDYLLHRQLLVQMKQSVAERFTQHFVSEHVPGYNSLYLIQSGPSPAAQKCLKNMGSGQQIKLIDKSDACMGDQYVHWVLELQDVPN